MRRLQTRCAAPLTSVEEFEAGADPPPGMFGAARAAFAKNVSSSAFWADVGEKGSLFIRVACLVHVVRTYGVEATAVRSHMCCC